MPWELVRAADAAQPGTRDAIGLAALVEQAMPAVTEAISEAERAAPEGTRPVVLTELAPLARYGHLKALSAWADLAAHRRQAIWAVAPQLLSNQGPVIDGRLLPLAAPGQFHRVDAEWLVSTPLGDFTRQPAVTIRELYRYPHPAAAPTDQSGVMWFKPYVKSPICKSLDSRYRAG